MEGNSTSRETTQVVDLTDVEDLPVNPLVNVESPRTRKRRASDMHDHSIAPGEEDGFEVVSVSRREPKTLRLAQNQRRRHHSTAYSEEGLDVVHQKTLTPQERLRQIQEQHARGEVVSTPRQSYRERFPTSFDSFGARHALAGGLLPPRVFHPYMMQPSHFGSHVFDHTNNSMLFGIMGHGQASNLEQSILDSTLEASMNEMEYRKKLDTALLLLPAEPSEASEGYTRSLDTEDELVCVKCNEPLGKLRRAPAGESELNSQKVFARGCGHAYCGKCTFAMKATKKGKACPVLKCKKVSPKKLRLFREVFL